MDNKKQAQQRSMDRSFSASSLDANPSVSQDPAAMTIDFLRARLLSERSASKAARQRAQHLAQKVLELEHRLESEIQLRKKLESADLKFISEYREELKDNGALLLPNFETDDPQIKNVGPKETIHSNDKENVISASKMERPNGGVLPRQLNFAEDGIAYTISDDEEREQITKKGILAWGRDRGIKRQQEKDLGQRTERFSRTLSQKSFSASSADGESPHKRWVGKSVRQIRNKRLHSTDDHPEDNTKEGLHCNEDRVTEVERVLEHQAELIEQFEAEENAQRAWEEEFREQKSLIENGSVQDTQMYRRSKQESIDALVKDEQGTEEGGKFKEGASKYVDADNNLSSQLIEDVDNQHLSKVQLVDYHSRDTDLKEDRVSTVSKIMHKAVLEDSSRTEIGENEGALNAMNMIPIESGDTLSFWSTGMAVTRDGSEGQQLGIVDAAKSKQTFEVASKIISEIQICDKTAKQGQSILTAESKSTQELESQYFTKTLPEIFNEELSRGRMGKKSDEIDIKEGDEQASSRNLDTEDVATSSSHQPLHQPAAYAQAQENGLTEGIFERLRGVKEVTADHATGECTQTVIHNPSRELRDIDTSVNGQAGVSGLSLDEAASHGDLSFSLMIPNTVRELADRGHERTVASENQWTTNVRHKAVEYGFHNHTSHEQAFDSTSKAVSSDSTDVWREDSAVKGEAVVDMQEGTPQRSSKKSPWGGGEGVLTKDANASHASSDNLMMDSPWEEVFRRRMKAQETSREQAGQTRHSSNPGMQELQCASSDQIGMEFHNLSSHPGSRKSNRDDSNLSWGYGMGNHFHQDTAFHSHRKSVDGGLDRVMDVLWALQIAKHQIQSSDEPSICSGYDGRDAFYVRPSSPAAGYPSPVRFAGNTTAPYVRDVKPFMAEMTRGSAGAGYARNPSKQHPNMQNVPRWDEPQIPSLLQGAYIRNVYGYDTRQNR